MGLHPATQATHPAPAKICSLKAFVFYSPPETEPYTTQPVNTVPTEMLRYGLPSHRILIQI
eukprot:456859-Amphidinium_carterae.1